MKTQKAEEPLSKGDATKGRILEVAEKVFADAGYSATRLDDIADIVGVKRATILHYFKTKKDLYDRVESSLFDDLHAAMAQRLAEVSDPFERLLALFDSWLDFHVARPTGARIIIRNTADEGPGGRNPVQFSEKILFTAEQIIREGQASGTFRPHNPVRIVTMAGGSILHYVCIASKLGDAREYEPASPGELEAFRALIHDMLRGLVLV